MDTSNRFPIHDSSGPPRKALNPAAVRGDSRCGCTIASVAGAVPTAKMRGFSHHFRIEVVTAPATGSERRNSWGQLASERGAVHHASAHVPLTVRRQLRRSDSPIPERRSEIAARAWKRRGQRNAALADSGLRSRESSVRINMRALHQAPSHRSLHGCACLQSSCDASGAPPESRSSSRARDFRAPHACHGERP